ncbi:hypothetical protein ACFX14_003098 [Malus domestica]|uniref:Uncharacterized protein n=1 Tax=Malus domestica TaxID=3750 RepID=A0A498IYJ5_MALDO|nr:hypothetical protein DVH24_042361 [Malus domestica]
METLPNLHLKGFEGCFERRLSYGDLIVLLIWINALGAGTKSLGVDLLLEKYLSSLTPKITTIPDDDVDSDESDDSHMICSHQAINVDPYIRCLSIILQHSSWPQNAVFHFVASATANTSLM